MITLPSVFTRKLDCTECPAKHLVDFARSKDVEELRLRALQKLGSSPEVLLLCEAAPTGRFVYDPSSNYGSDGLRVYLRRELTSDDSDDSLFEYLKQKKVWIVDSALCPLNQLAARRDRRHAATLCLSRHTRVYLDSFPSARVISIFHQGVEFSRGKYPTS